MSAPAACTVRCAGCGCGLVHDTDTERYTGGVVLIDPEAVDGATDAPRSGWICPATGEPHTAEPDGRVIADCNDRCESCGRILDCCGNCPQDHEVQR